jgi:starch-binding outer membrane protein, SusD/RagB family
MKLKYQNLFSHSATFCLLLCTCLICGCKKFVQIAPPDTQLASSSVFSSSSSATSAILAIYIQMFNNAESWNMAQNQGLLGDELTNYATLTSQIEFYTNGMLPVNNNGAWNNGYNYIYQANSIIEGLQNNGQIPVSINQQLTGEAKFIRAFWHFYLTNMYGNIPLVTTTSYTVNESIPRSQQPQIYSQIIQDLLDAESLVNANYVDATDTVTTIQRVRPTKGAAEALLARVYLYMGKYDSAQIEASKVIGNGSLYTLCTNLSPLMGPKSVFLMNSTEAIWQLSTPLPNSENTIDGQNFVLFGEPINYGANNSTTISPQLFNSFEAGDQRQTNWIGVDSSGSAPEVYYYFPYKYQSVNITQLSEYTMVLRLAEQYLIRSEAEVQQNDLTDAAIDLNVIRNRAGLANISDSIAASQSALQAAILHERQVELFTEWGHRWFDLIRTGTANSVMGSPGNVCQYKGGVWNPDWQLYPIPQSEIQNDSRLTQNPGY